MNPTDTLEDAGQVHPDDALLVAYLDSELTREERDLLEDRLVDDAALRVRLQSLQKTWDMLGALPDPVQNEKTVQTTLELVVSDLAGAASTVRSDEYFALTNGRSGSEIEKTKRYRPSGRTWAIVGVLLATSLATFGIGKWTTNRRTQQQIADLPLAIDLDAYMMATDLQLLRDLADDSRWHGLVANQNAAPNATAMVTPGHEQSLYSQSLIGDDVQTPTAEQLNSAINTWGDEERLVVSSRQDRFAKLDEESKQRLRESADRLRSLAEGAELLETARGYARLREQLDDSIVAAIETGTGTERELAIAEAIHQVMSTLGQVTGKNLSDEAVERIRFTLREIARMRIESRDESAIGLMKFLRSRIGEDMDEPMAEEFIAGAIVRSTRKQPPSWPGSPPESGKPPGTAPEEDPSRSDRAGSERPPETMGVRERMGKAFQNNSRFPTISPLDENELSMIEAMLPTSDYQSLQTLVSDPWMRSMVLRDWAEAAWSRFRHGPDSSKSLAERYEQLPSLSRDTIDLMPPAQARTELQQIHGMGRPGR